MVKQYLVDWTPDQEWAVQDWDRSDAYVVLASDYAALEAELARCRSANVYDGEAHAKIAALEARCGALKFELANTLEYARQTMPPTEFAEAMALVRSTAETVAEQSDEEIIRDIQADCKHPREWWYSHSAVSGVDGDYRCNHCNGIFNVPASELNNPNWRPTSVNRSVKP